jgi:hypothetical protein
LFSILLAGSAISAAQSDLVPATDRPMLEPTDQATEAAKTPSPDALTLKQKYLYSIKLIFGGAPLLAASVHAAIDQADNRPNQWGGGFESYADRLASHFGRSFLRQNIAFGVGALDHEDPRYFRSSKGGVWKRTGYAVAHTFVARNDDGSPMPAYSRFVADYSMPFLAQLWRPEAFRTGRALGIGSALIGGDAAYNIWQEFWPDIRKKLRLKAR